MPHHHPAVVREATELFTRFARFEYAMKRSNYGRRGNKIDSLTSGHSINPDWDALQRSNAVRDLWPRAAPEEAVKYLIDNPAKIYVKNGTSIVLGRA